MESRDILIIEDEPDIAELVGLHLADAGHHVRTEGDGRRGLETALGGRWDLVILDLMLPGVDGLEVCRRLRAQERYTSVLMLTARSTETDRVVGLEMGADDYLTKPFSVRELVARVRALFRRDDALLYESSPSRPISVGGLRIDPARRETRIDGRHVELTAKEFDLLTFFASHPGRVFTRGELLDRVWGYVHGGYEHTVNTHINRLRRKIEPDPKDPRYVLTVWGVGYRFPAADEVDRWGAGEPT